MVLVVKKISPFTLFPCFTFSCYVQEEMAELKAQLYLLEKEKKALELKLSTRQLQEQAYLVHIEHLKSDVEEQWEQRRRSLSSTGSSTKGKSAKVSHTQTHTERIIASYVLLCIN